MTRSPYRFKNIRTLLTQGFSEQELRDLCFDVPGFRPVYENIGASASKAEIVAKLLDHAERTIQVDALLAVAKEHNPKRYKAHEPYYSVDATSLVQKQLASYSKRLSLVESDPEKLMDIAKVKMRIASEARVQRLRYYSAIIDLLKEAGIPEESLKDLLQQIISSDQSSEGEI